MENLLKNIEDLREKIVKTMKLLDIDRKKEQAHELKAQMSRPGFWDDRERAVEVSRGADEMEKEVNQWRSLKESVKSLEELVAESQALKDDSLDKEAHEQYQKLKKQFEEFEFLVMFSHKYDVNNAVISIHAGTGGVDAQDWAEIIERMFLRFAEKMEWKAEILDRNSGNEAGIKNVSIHIKGRYAFGYLKSESGVHRLVRISPFDAEAMRHTSFALVEVIPELPEADEIEINENELRIDVFKASGPGGQGVNTTDSAIRITHIPTNTVVICQNERSQHQNKEVALRILRSKLLKKQEEEREKKELKLRGEAQTAEWGKQVRSYVMQPYKMVKDHRTNFETQDVDGVLNGDLIPFMEAYLRMKKK